MTFSVSMRDPETGDLGVAACTGIPAVGTACPFAEGGVGAVATQALVNPYLGPLALRELAQGRTPEEAIQAALAQDPLASEGERQLHLVDSHGRSAAYTGHNCTEWAGHRTIPNASIAGNMLVAEQVVDDMATAAAAAPAGNLARGLMSVIQAGYDAGGDMRGHVSAVLLVVRNNMVPLLRLHVERSDDPVGELWGLVDDTYEMQEHMVEYVEPKLGVGSS